MSLPDYYAVLGVSEDASGDEIQSAHRRKLRDSHPDRHPGDEAVLERAKLLGQARMILLSPKARAAYDAARQAPAPGGSPPDGADLGEVLEWLEHLSGVKADAVVEAGTDYLRRRATSFLRKLRR